MNRRAAVVAAALGAVVLVLSGCRGAYDLPLPGGAANRGDIMRVSAEFADVLDLVPQSSVKIDEVTVGSVEDIELNGWTALVTMRLPRDTELPDNAVANIRQTSLLGEKYVELSPPSTTAPMGALGEGDRIPLDRTGRNPEVEEVLSALSLLLNGGGVAQLKTIQTELSKALDGNEAQIKDLIDQLDTFIGGLDDQKSEITRAIDSIDRLATRLEAQKDQIGPILDQIPQGLKILADQRQQLTTLLQSLSRLGSVGTSVISQSKADTVANLQALDPILTQLTKAGDYLPQSLQLLLTYPFSDGALGAFKGDYVNLDADLDLDLRSLTNLLPGTANGGGNGPGGTGGPGTPGIPGLPTIPGTPLDPLLDGLTGGGGGLGGIVGGVTGGGTGAGSTPTPSSTPTSSRTSGGGLGILCPPLCASGAGESGASDTGDGWSSLMTGERA